jgi:hypothetical protein
MTNITCFTRQMPRKAARGLVFAGLLADRRVSR